MPLNPQNSLVQPLNFQVIKPFLRSLKPCSQKDDWSTQLSIMDEINDLNYVRLIFRRRDIFILQSLRFIQD